MFGVFVLHNARFCLCLEKIIKCSPCPFFLGGGGPHLRAYLCSAGKHYNLATSARPAPNNTKFFLPVVGQFAAVRDCFYLSH